MSGRVRQELTRSATVVRKAASATVITLLADNERRGWAMFYNESSAICYLKCGGAATATDYTVQIPANSFLELEANYTGIITAIWASATGNMQVTEFLT